MQSHIDKSMPLPQTRSYTNQIRRNHISMPTS
ncbi:hypothetical protein F383_04471 [Gossypium arboreum]|uniref:Uncharacterized protein n=1 Tax=Gossypium arboreum TaxID=29729 RepID=A0A0B0PCN9_GOSAR|nr:hypothetical protein F383_04471 [Gossypium arboreum]